MDVTHSMADRPRSRSRRRSLVPLPAALLAASLLAACRDIADIAGSTITEVEVTPASTTLSALGDTAQFTATAKDAYGRTVDGVAFRWESSTPAVATVDSSGLVIAVGNGSAAITATTGESSGSAALTVAQVVTSVEVDPVHNTLTALGDTLRLLAVARDARDNAVQGVPFRWSSTDSLVASVDATGLVRGVGEGLTRITATAGDVEGSGTVLVAIPTVVAVAVTPANPILTAFGATVQLAATAFDSAGRIVRNRPASWTSTDTSRVTVGTSGIATAVGNGTAEVTATVDGVTGGTTVTVAQAMGLVRVSPEGASISGGTQVFTAIAQDSVGHPMDDSGLVWTSLNPNVATIAAETGVATAVASGQATIAATLNGLVGYALLTVAIPGAAPVASWTQVTTNTTATLRGIWGSSTSDVYVVGSAGTILHYDGAQWTAVSSGTDQSLLDVWGTSGQDVYAVGAGGTILHWDGAGWTALPSRTTRSLHGVWGSSPIDVYVVGDSGTVLHYDGLAWKAAPGLEPDGHYWYLWGTARSNIYLTDAAAYAPRVLRFDGAAWHEFLRTGENGQCCWPRGVWGTSPTDVFITLNLGNIRPVPHFGVRHFDGAAWKSVASPEGSAGFIWGTSDSDIYAVGDGCGAHYDGTAWTGFIVLGQCVHRVWGTSHGNLYAVGIAAGALFRGAR